VTGWPSIGNRALRRISIDTHTGRRFGLRATPSRSGSTSNARSTSRFSASSDGLCADAADTPHMIASATRTLILPIRIIAKTPHLNRAAAAASRTRARHHRASTSRTPDAFACRQRVPAARPTADRMVHGSAPELIEAAQPHTSVHCQRQRPDESASQQRQQQIQRRTLATTETSPAPASRAVPGRAARRRLSPAHLS
jgi:hypothetical protein